MWAMKARAGGNFPSNPLFIGKSDNIVGFEPSIRYSLAKVTPLGVSFCTSCVCCVSSQHRILCIYNKYSIGKFRKSCYNLCIRHKKYKKYKFFAVSLDMRTFWAYNCGKGRDDKCR